MNIHQIVVEDRELLVSQELLNRISSWAKTSWSLSRRRKLPHMRGHGQPLWCARIRRFTSFSCGCARIFSFYFRFLCVAWTLTSCVETFPSRRRGRKVTSYHVPMTSDYVIRRWRKEAWSLWRDSCMKVSVEVSIHSTLYSYTIWGEYQIQSVCVCLCVCVCFCVYVCLSVLLENPVRL